MKTNMTNESIERKCQVFAEQLASTSEKFVPFEGTAIDFRSITARFLEVYGGSLGLSFLLRHHSWLKHLRHQDLRQIVLLMRTNRVMGSDVILEFYGRFTQVPLEQFNFLDALGINHKTAYGASFFGAVSSDEDFGGWEVLSPQESVARVREQNNLSIEVTNELKKIVSLHI
jgi:hypothetical protein